MWLRLAARHPATLSAARAWQCATSTCTRTTDAAGFAVCLSIHWLLRNWCCSFSMVCVCRGTWIGHFMAWLTPWPGSDAGVFPRLSVTASPITAWRAASWHKPRVDGHPHAPVCWALAAAVLRHACPHRPTLALKHTGCAAHWDPVTAGHACNHAILQSKCHSESTGPEPWIARGGVARNPSTASCDARVYRIWGIAAGGVAGGRVSIALCEASRWCGALAAAHACEAAALLLYLWRPGWGREMDNVAAPETARCAQLKRFGAWGAAEGGGRTPQGLYRVAWTGAPVSGQLARGSLVKRATRARGQRSAAQRSRARRGLAAARVCGRGARVVTAP